MTTDTDIGDLQDAVTVSETAAETVRDLMVANDLDPETAGLRLYVQQGGCAGLSYGMRFESEPGPDDHVFHTNDLQLIVDPASLEHVQQSHLSFEDSLQGAGFVVDNPNSEAECGCGESFRT